MCKYTEDLKFNLLLNIDSVILHAAAKLKLVKSICPHIILKGTAKEVITLSPL